MFIIISLWFVTAFLASFMAKNKNRNPIAWFFIAFFLLGLFSLILLMLLPSKKRSVPEVALSSSSEPIIPSNDGFEEFDTKNKNENALRISTSRSLNWYLITADGVRKGPLGYQAFKLLVREQKTLAKYLYGILSLTIGLSSSALLTPTYYLTKTSIKKGYAKAQPQISHSTKKT